MNRVIYYGSIFHNEYNNVIYHESIFHNEYNNVKLMLPIYTN